MLEHLSAFEDNQTHLYPHISDKSPLRRWNASYNTDYIPFSWEQFGYLIT